MKTAIENSLVFLLICNYILAIIVSIYGNIELWKMAIEDFRKNRSIKGILKTAFFSAICIEAVFAMSIAVGIVVGEVI